MSCIMNSHNNGYNNGNISERHIKLDDRIVVCPLLRYFAVFFNKQPVKMFFISSFVDIGLIFLHGRTNGPMVRFLPG